MIEIISFDYHGPKPEFFCVVQFVKTCKKLNCQKLVFIGQVNRIFYSDLASRYEGMCHLYRNDYLNLPRSQRDQLGDEAGGNVDLYDK